MRSGQMVHLTTGNINAEIKKAKASSTGPMAAHSKEISLATIYVAMELISGMTDDATKGSGKITR